MISKSTHSAVAGNERNDKSTELGNTVSSWALVIIISMQNCLLLASIVLITVW